MAAPCTSLAHSRQVSSGLLVSPEMPFRPQSASSGQPILFSGRAIGLVVGEIGGAPGAVVLAGGVDAQPVLERGAVMSERPRIEDGEAFRLGARRGLPVPERYRVAADDVFRPRRRQGEKGPVPDPVGEPRIDVMPHGMGRHDVEHREPVEAAGVVERQSVGHPAAAVMAGECKAGITSIMATAMARLVSGA
jgi:hypothetical protein